MFYIIINLYNYSFTEPIVNPEIKYFWKNGYVRAIGTITIIAIAIRTDSVGIAFLYSTSESPPYGLFARYSSLF